MKTLNKTNGVYHAFGLNIDSELLLPDMPKISGTTDVVIQYGPVPEAIPDASLVGVRYQATPRAFLLRVDGIASYYVKNGRAIIIEPENGVAEEEIRLFLLGSVMGGLLYQRGILPLHASAVEVDGGAVLFMGPSSIGKSTLAGGFQEKGYPLLADDVCGANLNGHKIAQVAPGFPWLKLWGDALKRFKRDESGLSRVRLNPDFDKFFVPFNPVSREPRPDESSMTTGKSCDAWDT